MMQVLSPPRGMRNRRGVTMIEIMVALFIFAFLLVIMGGSFLIMKKAYGQGAETLSLQQNGTQVLEQIERDVRGSRWVTRVSATELRCFDEDSTETVHYTLQAINGKNYVMRNGTQMTKEACMGLTYTLNTGDGVVRVQMEVADTQDNRVSLDARANLRNRNASAF